MLTASSRSTVAILVLRTAGIARIPIVVSNSVQNSLSFTNLNKFVPEKAWTNLFEISFDAGLNFATITPTKLLAGNALICPKKGQSWGG